MCMVIFVAKSCVVSTISGNVNHNRKSRKTVLKFEADDKNATYTCKLDRQNYKPCKFYKVIVCIDDS